MKDSNYFDLIDKFVNDELDIDEKAKFETSLITNSELYNQYELYNKVKIQFDDSDMIGINEVINEVKDDHHKNKNKPYKFLGAVTNFDVFIIFIILGIAIFLFLFYIFYLRF
jgi:hypothetical protein